MSSWIAKPLADVCERITDGSHRTPPFTEEGYPFATVAHVDADGTIDLASCKRISSSDFEELKRNDCRPLPGDVLFSKDGTVGKVAVIDFDTDFIVLSSLAILRPKRDVLNQSFLAYALRSEPVLGEAINRKSGSAIRRIVLRDLSQVSIPIPPLAEQGRIVRLVDEADELRKLRAQADRRTAALIPALFHEMFGDPAGNPMRWPKANLGELCELVNGVPFKPSDWDGSGLPIVRIQNLNDSAKSFNYTSKKLAEKFRVRPGDILLSWSGTPGTSFGCFNWNGPEGWLNQHIFNVRLKTQVDGEFFIHSVNARLGELIAKAHGGVGLQHVTKGTLNEVEMLVPSLVLQKEFAARVSEIRAMQAEQAASRCRLDDLFQSMLHRAFQGEL